MILFTLEWVSSYRSEQSFSVAAFRCKSSSTFFAYGVPQGSVSGTSFFMLYLLPLQPILSPFKDIYIQEVFSNFMKRKQKSLLVYLTDSFHFCQIFCQEPWSSFCFHLSLWMFRFKIKFLVHSCFYHLRNTGKLISNTSRSEMEIVIHAFMSSHLSHCGSLFACLKKASLERLQVFQNTTARLLTQFSKNSHVTELLIQVHFVPIYLRVHFKFLVFSY